MSDILEAKGIDFYYGDQQALFKIDCSLKRGKIVGLVGANGAGKTTLMKCLAGFRSPENGKIFVNGMDVESETKKCLGLIKFIPDYAYLYDELSVREHLKYSQESHYSKTTVTSIIELFGLEKYKDSKIKNLSRGWRQRVGVAVQVIANPQYILADEPASGLDPEARIALAKILIKLKEDGMGVLISSHILDELDQYCDEVIVMEDGRVQRQAGIEGNHGIDRAEYNYDLKSTFEPEHMMSELFKLKESLKILHIEKTDKGVLLRSGLKPRDLGPLLFKSYAALGLYEFSSKKISIKEIYQTKDLKINEVDHASN